MSSDNKFYITQTLLSAWDYVYKTDNGYEDFLRTLRKEPFQPTKQMLEGMQFEAMVNATLDGNPPPDDHKWAEAITATADYLNGAQQQVVLSKTVNLDGMELVLYGIADFVKAGVIYDTKKSSTYHYGKYLQSPQWHMYLEMLPEAYKFEFVVFDGKDVYTEAYTRDDEQENIYNKIRNFFAFLERMNLMEVYKEYWKSKY
jgi:hypothetical protein